MNIFGFVPGYEQYIYEAGKEPLFLLLLSFLIAFFLTRLYTRLGRVRGWGSGNVGGVHLHHIVPGIILALVAGLLLAATSGAQSTSRGLIAIVFGAGAALILDEFALVLHLEDVYWSERGRLSVETAILGVLVMGLMLVATTPFGSSADSTSTRLILTLHYLAFNVIFAVATLLKGKFILGTAGIFIAPFGWIGTLRLAKPYSPWAVWFYNPSRGRQSRRAKRERKLARATKRFENGRFGRLEHWLVDLIGGSFEETAPNSVAASSPQAASGGTQDNGNEGPRASNAHFRLLSPDAEQLYADELLASIEVCIQLRDDPGVPPATRLAAGRIVETVRDRTSAKRVTANDDGPLHHRQRLIKDAEALEAS